MAALARVEAANQGVQRPTAPTPGKGVLPFIRPPVVILRYECDPTLVLYKEFEWPMFLDTTYRRSDVIFERPSRENAETTKLSSVKPRRWRRSQMNAYIGGTFTDYGVDRRLDSSALYARMWRRPYRDRVIAPKKGVCLVKVVGNNAVAQVPLARVTSSRLCRWRFALQTVINALGYERGND